MTDERTLPDALRQLENAITALIDPRPTTIANNVIWIDSIYTELRHAIHGHRAGSTRQPSEPQPPLWIDGLDLCRDIDDQAKAWEPNPAGFEHHTVNRLRALLERSWRPQDTGTIENIARGVNVFVRRYTTLTETKAKTLPNPCPRCNQKWAYRVLDGERLRQPSLQVTTEECRCLACGANWPAREFRFLAERLLGYAPPEGVAAS
jgi:hypothetical protein